MEFKDKLKQLRLNKNISQEAIAKELMTSRSTYAKWETGIRLPNSASLELIAKYFDITVEELFDNKETTNLTIKTNDRLNDLTTINSSFEEIEYELGEKQGFKVEKDDVILVATKGKYTFKFTSNSILLRVEVTNIFGIQF